MVLMLEKTGIFWIALLSLVVSCKEDSGFKGSGKNISPKKEEAAAVASPTPSTDASIGTQSACANRPAQFYNFILVFDASRSQIRTDPTNVRGTSALTFAQRIAELARQEQNLQAFMTVIRFSVHAEASPRGWIAVKPERMADISNDIRLATANPDGNTAYTPALIIARQLLAAAPGSKGRTRNYVVFLTDGEPSDSTGQILAAVNDILSLGAAIIGVAAGQSISAEGQQKVQSMSRIPPTFAAGNRTLNPYKRVTQPDELNTMWSEIFDDAFSCN
jgi:hypothetical protein